MDIRGTILEVFHIHRVYEGSLYGAKYISIPHEELELVYTSSILLEDNAVRWTRVVNRKGVDGPFHKFNPSQPIHDSTTVWLVDRIQDLQIDLAGETGNHGSN